jgi:hypothetical protein
MLKISRFFSGRIALEKIKIKAPAPKTVPPKVRGSGLQPESISLEKSGAQKRGGTKPDLRPWKFFVQKGVGN